MRQDALDEEGAWPVNGKVVGLLSWQHFSNLHELRTGTSPKNQSVTHGEFLHRLGSIEVSIIRGNHCPCLFFGVEWMPSGCLDHELLPIWRLQEELSHPCCLSLP